MNLVDYFKRRFFAIKASNFLGNMRFNELIEIMKAEPNIFQNMPLECALTQDNNIYAYKEDNGTFSTYVLYQGKLRFILIDGEEKIVKVSLLGEAECWEIKTSGKKIVIDSPDTKSYTIYTFCDVLMPTGRMMFDERYTKGNWDELVYNTMTHISEHIYSFKEKNKYNKLYDSKNCE
jgi:hypothetical protein